MLKPVNILNYRHASIAVDVHTTFRLRCSMWPIILPVTQSGQRYMNQVKWAIITRFPDEDR